MTETADNKANRLVAGLVMGGGLIGALAGVAASRLVIRADEQALKRHQQRGPQGLSLSPMAILPLLIGLIGLVRQIGALGDEQ